MVIVNSRLAGLSIGLVVTALASPSFAQRSEDPIAARAEALRACSLLPQKYSQHTWADVRIDPYRACMAEHGQME